MQFFQQIHKYSNDSVNRPSGACSATAGRAGLTLIDVIVGVAIFAILLAGVFALFRSSLTLLFDSKARSGATALLEERMEYIRSLPYRQIGTEGGIPSGNLQSEESISMNNIDYDRRTFVQYYDDAADGVGDQDSNDVVQDYKRAKVAVSWTAQGNKRQVESASFIVPDGIESTQGGGTLSLKVFDATADAVEDAEIHIFNSTTDPQIDTTTYTDPSGETRFSGAPAASGYQITVTKPNYSQAQTYDQTDTNVSPDPGHLTVSSSSVTTASFRTDELSDMSLQTVTPLVSATWTKPFTDSSDIAASQDVAVQDGHLDLAAEGSGYATSGHAYTTDFGTSSTYRWQEARFSATTSADTTVRLYVVEKESNGYSRLTDSQLTGNSTGFSSSPIDLSGVSTTTFPQLALEARLRTADTSTTPTLNKVAGDYVYGRSTQPNVSFRIRGEKTIGETPDGSPIYKHEFTTTTDSTGQRDITNTEWDTYHFTPTPTFERRIASACPREPIDLQPATTTDLTFAVAEIGSGTGNTLRVDVDDAAGDPLAATTTLTASSTNRVQTTGPCGQAFYTDLDGSQAYDVAAEADGFTTNSQQDVTPDGSTVITIQLTQS